MTGYLLDKSFLSAFAPGRPLLPSHVQNWLAEQRERGSWQLSSIVILEVERGILPIDLAIVREAGKLEDATIARGANPGLADVLIAATARLHGLSVLTANTRHFAILDVPYLNPFTEGVSKG
ncbi:PIN domain-containing protein [Mesorhizobium sp. M0136]|uniref:PIN domain-containing protein n=1 Tax=Mesorhizobium sp. M0136 TaxID=2956890 RepID=UPI0033374CEA